MANGVDIGRDKRWERTFKKGDFEMTKPDFEAKSIGNKILKGNHPETNEETYFAEVYEDLFVKLDGTDNASIYERLLAIDELVHTNRKYLSRYCYSSYFITRLYKNVVLWKTLNLRRT